MAEIAAIRHNNPGNVSLPMVGWKEGGKIVGVKGQPGYAEFPDMMTGWRAVQHRIWTYIDHPSHKRTSIRMIGKAYAEHTGWPTAVAKISGIGIDDPLRTSDEKQMRALIGAIVKQETGKTYAQLGIDLRWPGPLFPGIDEDDDAAPQRPGELSEKDMGVIGLLLGNSTIGSWLRGAAASASSAFAANYLGMDGAEAIAFGTAVGTIIAGVWGGVAKKIDPPQSAL